MSHRPLFTSQSGNVDLHLIQCALVYDWVSKSIHNEENPDPFSRFCTTQPRSIQRYGAVSGIRHIICICKCWPVLGPMRRKLWCLSSRYDEHTCSRCCWLLFAVALVAVVIATSATLRCVIRHQAVEVLGRTEANSSCWNNYYWHNTTIFNLYVSISIRNPRQKKLVQFSRTEQAQRLKRRRKYRRVMKAVIITQVCSPT